MSKSVTLSDAATRIADLLDLSCVDGEYARGAVEGALAVMGALDDDHRYRFESAVLANVELEGRP